MAFTRRTRIGLLLFAMSGLNTHAFAQVDLSGSWASRRFEETVAPIPVDYTGLPLNDEGRIKALSYSESQLSMVERQCNGWPPFYLAQGPFGMKIWNNTDPVSGETISWMIGAWEDVAPVTIWMDGRPRPSKNAPHPRGGFTTGTWEGETLVAYTTHMKAGSIRRNGAPSSDQAAMATRFIRHGNLLTLFIAVEDPIYLEEPLLISKTYELGPSPVLPVGPPCIPAYEGTAGDGHVPHYLPGENPFVDELTKKYGIPRDAVLGGSATIYPEYGKTLR